jgi:uncharacterized phiE125 gp8 family phage protein
MSGVESFEPPVSLAEAQAYLRVDTGQEEALLAGLVRSATGLCEAFVNQMVMARAFTEELAPSGAWQRLSKTPVREITAVEAVDSGGIAILLPAANYAIDIDASGDGWVRASLPPDGGRIRISGRAGMADEPNQVPEPIRQGVLRLVAHLFTARDGEGGEPPAAVTALWRPYRRMRLS